MFGKQSRVSPAELQKQLLIAESELNRAQLSEEWQTMTSGVRGLAHRAKTIGLWASSAGLLAAGYRVWHSGSLPSTPAKLSWFQRFLNGARVASKIWCALCARTHKEERQPPPAKPEPSKVGGPFASILLGLLLVIGGITAAPRLAGAPIPPPTSERDTNSAPESPGPTLCLDYGRGGLPGNPVAEFMYFVALISPEPVSIVKSPGNTQCARMLSARRSFTARSFLVTCDFEFVGEGNQQEVLDHTEKVRCHERELKEGGTLNHQLGYISVEGSGGVSIEVAGTMTGPVPTVTEIRLRFNDRGQPSPVTIGLHDIRYLDGSIRVANETVTRVNTLLFRRRPGPSKMEITVASVKRKDASSSFLQNLLGGLKGTTVNLFIQPVAVEAAGSDAMLNFGLALATEAPAFTFPRAKNLKAEVRTRAKGETKESS